MEEKTNLTFTFQARAQQHSTLSPFFLTHWLSFCWHPGAPQSRRRVVGQHSAPALCQHHSRSNTEPVAGDRAKVLCTGKPAAQLVLPKPAPRQSFPKRHGREAGRERSSACPCGSPRPAPSLQPWHWGMWAVPLPAGHLMQVYEDHAFLAF